ncbi:MAG TPA: TrmH family RNA methyltransferase [Sphaerochaeta sp.]|nr:TrmH family RNA methyltransferase [Sphaerochaeta sp.]
MITIAKLKTLKDRTCVRKCALLFHEQAQSILQGQEPDHVYIEGLCLLFSSQQFLTVLDDEQIRSLHSLYCLIASSSVASLPFILEDMHYALLGALGSEPSDWDFVDEEGALDLSKRVVLPHILILDRLRSPFNVGSIFRSADSFGISEIWLVEGTASPVHPRSVKSARGCIDTVSYRYFSESDLIEKLTKEPISLFALELGGSVLEGFPFPFSGAAVIGSEEMGVSPALLSLCDKNLGRVSIALGGTKASLNVSVATGIMLQRWYATVC